MASVRDSALDAQALLGLDRLVQALAPASARHLATGELVHDDDLAVLDDVVPVALVQRVRLERGIEVPGEPRVRVVQVLDAQQLLDLVDAVLGRGDGLVLEVDEEVAALLLALGPPLEARDEPGEGEVEVRGLLRLARDDERGPRLVDEDVVNLVHDRVRAFPLHALVHLQDHVVPQVVEAELVVGAVGDVGRVRLPPLDGAQVDQPLVAGGVAGLEQVGRVMGDDAHGQAQEVEHRSHPLGVAPGEVVVGRDDVDAAAGQGVEDGGERRDEGLALARPHLRDLPLVEDDRAHQLDVELAHVQRPLHGLAAGGEDLRDDLVQRLLRPLLLALVAGLQQVPASLQVRVVELVLGRFLGLRGLTDVGPDGVDPLPDLGLGEALVLGFQLVDPVDERLDPGQLPVVVVEES